MAGRTERVSRYGRVRSHVLFRHQILAHRQVDSANAYCVGPKTRRNGDAFVLCSGPIVVDLYVDGFCMSTCNGDRKPESTASGQSLPSVDKLSETDAAERCPWARHARILWTLTLL